MSKTLYTSKGNPVGIGREIGKGGEGSVFEVPSLANQVAKIYHKSPEPKKQAKLSFMSSTADADLIKYVAWPQETLHLVPGGPVLGFLMPKVSSRDPVHMVYSPAHRRQGYPKAAWDFLLHVARNIASSFETVHGHGHIIGDVNQNSFMVGRDSTVVLIDSDSFQVNAKGILHLCEVGVPHFTPPELQSLSSFNGFTRTTNHDNFGLPLLLFHVLFGGRHPYSGVPLRSGVGDALENDIKNFRYAYARDNQARGFSPPPRSIPISALPAPLESMFHQAFTEKGATGARPSAQQWVASLDALRSHLRKCGASSMHVYPDHQSACPWCDLERQGVVYFVDLGATFTPTPSGFVLTRAWALIEAVPAPPQYSIPQPAGISVTAKRLPNDIPGDGTIVFYRMIVVAVVLIVLAAVPALGIFVLIGGFFGWTMAGNAGSVERKIERENRRKSLETARQNYVSLVANAKKDAGPDGFQARKAQLVKLKEEYEQLTAEEKKEIDKLQLTAHQRQMQSFLEKFFIDNANISGIGPTRKAALASFGIETAADVHRNRVIQVRGFGEALTSALLDWRASCERRFQFNPAAAGSSLDKNAIHIKFAAKRATLENLLLAGPVELRKLCQSAMEQQTTLKPLLEVAAREVAQAEADFQLV